MQDILALADRYREELRKSRPFTDAHLLEEIRKYYRVGLTYTSNALEGNTLTESETKILLEDGITAGQGKPLRYVFEALGHARSYDYMFSLIGKKRVEIDDIFQLHKLFYSMIDEGNAGRLRTVPVVITGSAYKTSSPAKLEDEMEKLGEWMRSAEAKEHPVVYAAELHKNFVFIHPFIDGNGRVARLLMNMVLIQNGYMPAVIAPILRTDYIALLEKAHKTPEPFTRFIAERVIDTARDMMRLLDIPLPKQT